MKVFFYIILVTTASLSGFVVHVITIEWLPDWIGQQMQGVELRPSWAVRYVAAMTSVEYGVSAIVIYYLSREKLIKYGKFKAFLMFSGVLLSINAILVRQPLMDYLIGNPLHVVMVQNVFKWMTWVLLSFVVVYGYEFINRKNRLVNMK
jgi:hypothetical protein